MDTVIWDRRPSGLRDPVMICAFQGWNDAGEAGTMAVDTIVDVLGGNPIATIDLEQFLDLRETRPTVRAVNGEVVELRWPETEMSEVFAPESERDLVVVTGPEPAINWRAYCNLILDIQADLECSRLVMVGAFLADVPHTAPVAVGCSTNDAELLRRLDSAPNNYEGPGGISAVISHEARRRGTPYASLWAAVPHYIAAMPNPKAALALIDRLETITGVAVDATSLKEDLVEQEHQIDQAIQQDSDLRGFVEQLEDAAGEDGESAQPTEADLPSGDSIVREVQRYLREQDPDPSGD